MNTLHFTNDSSFLFMEASQLFMIVKLVKYLRVC